jgi:hypothetical protein
MILLGRAIALTLRKRRCRHAPHGRRMLPFRARRLPRPASCFFSEIVMTRATRCNVALTGCTLALAASMAGAQTSRISDSEAAAAKSAIEADYKAARAACDRMSGNAKDLCMAAAGGGEKVAKAELEHRRSGSAADARKVALARADADFDLAKERCDDFGGPDKDVCMKRAQDSYARAKADAN